MAFVPSAWTMPEVMATVVNITTVRPAVAYPFVSGLRFIPVFVLIFTYWVLLGLRRDAGFVKNPGLGKAYILLGIVFLAMTCIGIATGYDDYRLWQAGLPGRGTILVGYAAVLAVNLAIGLVAYRFFRRESVSSYRALFFRCGIAYLLLASPAVLIERQYNILNRHYLDRRGPAAYVAANPDAIKHRRTITTEVGPDLASLLNDPGFEAVLRSKRFYKQNFDEPFQLLSAAVMFGDKIDSSSPQGEPTFVIIRFPQELAATLRFQLVAEDD